MNGPKSVTATFAPPNTIYALAVATAGGTVTSDVPGIDCGTSCVGGYGAGVPVTLTPSASPVAWGGACSGSGACVVPMTRARAVTASIGGAALGQSPVAVSVTGQGTVSSTPAGIQCGTACGGSFARGSTLTLTAAPAPGEVFAGWDGSCRGVYADVPDLPQGRDRCRRDLREGRDAISRSPSRRPGAARSRAPRAGSPAARTATGGSAPARTPSSPRSRTRAGPSSAGAARARGRRRRAGST